MIGSMIGAISAVARHLLCFSDTNCVVCLKLEVDEIRRTLAADIVYVWSPVEVLSVRPVA